MNVRLKLLLMSLGTLATVIVFTVRLDGQELKILPARAVVIEVTNPPTAESQPFSSWTFLDKLQEAKDLVTLASGSGLDLKVGKKDIVYYERRISRDKDGNITSITSKRMTDPEREVALVVIDLVSGELELIKITEKGNELTYPSEYEISNFERPNGITNNAWNTCRRIIEPKDRVVLLNVWPHYVTVKVARPIRNKSGKVIRTAYANKEVVENVVYTPHCDELNVPELIESGKNYRKTISREALEILRERGVRSISFPNKLLADVITEGKYLKIEYFERLPLIEHMDYSEFTLDKRKSAERVDVILGTNLRKAYSLTCSRAGACGQMQYTKRTWNSMSSKNRAAKLPSFETGVIDPAMSMMASMLLHDNNFKACIDKFGLKKFEDACGEEMLAANYNGGTVRPHNALKASILQGLEDWLINPMRKQTKEYIEKLRYVRREYN